MGDLVQSWDMGAPESVRQRIRTELDTALMRRLRTILPLLTLFYAAASASHFMLVGWRLPPPLVWLNIASGAVGLGFSALVWRPSVHSRWAHPLGTVTALLVLANSLAQVGYYLDPSHMTNVVLVLVGAGCTFLVGRWLAVVIANSLGGSIALAAFSPTALDWVSLSYLLIGATVAAIVAFNLRTRTYQRLIQGRLEEEQRKLELKEVEERYNLAVAGANDGLWYWDLRTDKLFFSHRWKAILGCSNGEIGDRPDDWFERVHVSDRQRVRLDILEHLKGATPRFQSEYRLRHENGSYLWVISRGLASRDEEGKPVRFAGSLTDISQLKRAEWRLLHDAYHDRLTGLPNRNFFMDRLTRAVERTKTDRSHQFAVAFMDLDQFKVVNDNLGHLVGDQLLAAVAERLREVERPEDISTRFGGDEFVLIFEGVRDRAGAVACAQKVQEALAEPFQLSGHEVFTTASVGIALSGGPYEKAADLLRDADIAMYQAKAEGVGRCSVFNRDMHASSTKRWSLGNELRYAVARGELFLQYQPLVSAASGMITGAEALVRWRHPSGRLVPPSDFIPLAEEMGLIKQIGAWVLETACTQIQGWQQQGLPVVSVSVNVSPSQLRGDNFADLVNGVLDEVGLEPQLLRLELTESALVENEDVVRVAFKSLFDSGIGLTIDDFGTGYSSLSYLKHFNFDVLKVSPSFLEGAPTDPNANALVTGLIDLAHSLSLQVVVEGVETREQLAFLRTHGCDLVQGYLASRPINADDFADLLLDAPCLLPKEVGRKVERKLAVATRS